ncbi:DUF5643 domain-containing protein [Bacillus canaveralius]|uniref:DUF5643 domain-containing protein n=1 Tax=Bacillus canaveralius TaxID=1403243 RepID=UPI000F770562|nr:DUF5643 domain-containing protein [Bacillus canaveralius]RSK54627.1 hypothetical protein EJA13_04940 [Bacillus canaveralius]
MRDIHSIMVSRITGAYYDGEVIGVDFHIKGDVEKDKAGQYMALYEIFDGDERMGETKELVYLNPTDKGYAGHIQLNYPKAELPPEATFPLAFLRIGKEEGGWKFDVPIKQLPYETAEVDKESSDIHSNIKVHFDSIIAGRSSTAIDYTATFPNEGTKDQVRLEIYDDQGKRFERLTDGIDLETTTKDNQIKVKGRTIIPQSTYLEIKPSVALYEKDQFVELEKKTPFEIKSSRQNLAVKVEKMVVEGKNFTVDFQVNNGQRNNQDFTFFKNFARNDVLLVKESLKHSLTILYKETLQIFRT